MNSVETAVVPVGTPANLFGEASPEAVIHAATERADALARVIRQRPALVAQIGGREYVRVEGWTLLGTMLGVFPVAIWTRPLAENGWEARVEARTLDGRVVGAAEAMVCRDEPAWHDRPEFALRSMAQTRATAKALRLPLGFVMALAGYEATPAEEMEGVHQETQRKEASRLAAEGGLGEPVPRANGVPLCPEHKREMILRPAGVSKKTGKPYDAFYGCPVRECKETVWQSDWEGA